ncbi:MAG: hypothetical protein JWO56_2639 [Acidobacteria bacterium]|nr:hypothetical protein [Acidobacteriota bacterium]
MNIDEIRARFPALGARGGRNTSQSVPSPPHSGVGPL